MIKAGNTISLQLRVYMHIIEKYWPIARLLSRGIEAVYPLTPWTSALLLFMIQNLNQDRVII